MKSNFRIFLLGSVILYITCKHKLVILLNMGMIFFSYLQCMKLQQSVSRPEHPFP